MEQTHTNTNINKNPPKNIGKGTSNPKDGSSVECTVNCLEINVFFDGTWNSRYNSDRYNDPNQVYKVQETINLPENQKKTRRPFDGDTTRAEHLLKKEYKATETSFARAPTGVDQMARAFGGNERMVVLYADGAGAITPHKVREQANPLAPNQRSDYDLKTPHHGLAEKDFSSDSMIGSGLGMGDSGVYGKLGQMFRKIYNVIQQKSQGMQIDHVSFNVYGFSRGAATARMFVHRVLNYGYDKDIIKEVDKLLNQEEHYVSQQPFDNIPSKDNPTPPPKQLSFQDILNPARFRVKFVGLFDTVSSIGTNHDDDVVDEKQQLYFDDHRRPNQVVHIVAGHEFRQKFAVTTIASAVQNGCGFEVVLPGCHTDIGDGLETRWVKSQNEKTDKQKWENKHVDDPTTICQKYNLASAPFAMLTKIKLFSPLVLSQVVQAEEKALMNLQQADFDDIITILDKQGWFSKEKGEIWRDDDILTMDKIKVHRKFDNTGGRVDDISKHYPKIATKLMFDIMTDIGINRNYDFSKYDINTFDGDIMLQGLSKDLIDKAWNKYQDYKTNKTQYFVNENIINGTQEGMTCYVSIQDTQKSKILFHDYLHWCSTMKRDPISLLVTYVSVPQINPQTNQFYRTVYQG